MIFQNGDFSYIIRNMEEKDLIQVAELEKRNFSAPWSYQAFSELLLKENVIYLVAESEATIIGVCGLVHLFGEGEISNVSVDVNLRNKGIANNLLQQLFLEAQSQGVNEFTLEVREGNKGAIHLYEHNGFHVEGIRKNFYENPSEHALIMWKRDTKN